MPCNKYRTTQINDTECIGDSLDKINNNFLILRNAYCDIRTELNNRLRVMNQNIPLPEYTETMVFSGTRTAVRVTSGDNPYDGLEQVVDNGSHKTVFIPVTGVTRLIAGSYISLESSQPLGRGVVTVNFELPPRPKQVRTFMYQEDGNNGALSRPSYTRLQTFINTQLKIGFNENIPITTNTYATDVSRENDEIYIVYFKTARNSITLAAGGSQSYSGYSAFLRSTSFSGAEKWRSSSQGIKNQSSGSYTASWPSDTAERSLLVTITYKFRYSGSEYVPVINDSTGQWPKYSYSIAAAPNLPGTAIGAPSDISVPVPGAAEEVVRYFYNNDSFAVPAGISTIELLVVGGGGGGGIAPPPPPDDLTPDRSAGGGGAGGYAYYPAFPVAPGATYNITVGTGGTAGPGPAQAGGSSIFGIQGSTNSAETVIVAGGGGGANGKNTNAQDGASGGGGAGTNSTPGNSLIIAGVSQGFAGGNGQRGRGGGGGGVGPTGGSGVGGSVSPSDLFGGEGGAGRIVPTTSKVYTGLLVCAGGAGGVDKSINPNYNQRPDPLAGNGQFKYGCGGGAGINGSPGIIGIAYRQGIG